MNSIHRNILKNGVMAFSALLFVACGSGGSDNAMESGNKKGQGPGKASSKGEQRMEQGGASRKGGRPGAGSSMKQVDVSDKELQNFYELSQEVMPIQKKFQKDQRKKVEDSEMSMKRYRQILMAQRQKKDPGMSQKEKGQMQEIQKKQREMMKKMRQEVRKVVENKEGMAWDRFNTIAKAINSDPQLKKRFDKLRNKGSAGSAPRRTR